MTDIEERAFDYGTNIEGSFAKRTALSLAYKQGATDQDQISRADEREKVIKKACECYRKTLITHYGENTYNKMKNEMEIVEGLFQQMLEESINNA